MKENRRVFVGVDFEDGGSFATGECPIYVVEKRGDEAEVECFEHSLVGDISSCNYCKHWTIETVERRGGNDTDLEDIERYVAEGTCKEISYIPTLVEYLLDNPELCRASIEKSDGGPRKKSGKKQKTKRFNPSLICLDVAETSLKNLHSIELATNGWLTENRTFTKPNTTHTAHETKHKTTRHHHWNHHRSYRNLWTSLYQGAERHGPRDRGRTPRSAKIG